MNFSLTLEPQTSIGNYVTGHHKVLINCEVEEVKYLKIIAKKLNLNVCQLCVLRFPLPCQPSCIAFLPPCKTLCGKKKKTTNARNPEHTPTSVKHRFGRFML